MSGSKLDNLELTGLGGFFSATLSTVVTILSTSKIVVFYDNTIV